MCPEVNTGFLYFKSVLYDCTLVLLHGNTKLAISNYTAGTQCFRIKDDYCYCYGQQYEAFTVTVFSFSAPIRIIITGPCHKQTIRENCTRLASCMIMGFPHLPNTTLSLAYIIGLHTFINCLITNGRWSRFSTRFFLPRNGKILIKRSTKTLMKAEHFYNLATQTFVQTNVTHHDHKVIIYN